MSATSGRAAAAVVVVTIAVLAVAAWVSDTVTLQGERTVYTVRCEGGEWEGTRCMGQLAAADRFKFRALSTHREVLFWTVGSLAPSGKFADCTVEDGRNWTCRCGAEAAATITCQMRHGGPVRETDNVARAFHAVHKWRWMLLRLGIPSGNQTDE